MTIDTKSIILIITISVVVLFLVIFIVRRGRSRQSSSEEANEQIYIGNLPYRVNERDLEDYFSGYGRIQDVRVVKDRRTGRSKGYGFITYGSVREANKSLSAHGTEFQGRSIVVRIAKPR